MMTTLQSQIDARATTPEMIATLVRRADEKQSEGDTETAEFLRLFARQWQRDLDSGDLAANTVVSLGAPVGGVEVTHGR